MRLTVAYSKIKKRNLVLINNDTYQRETISEWPIRQPLTLFLASLFPEGQQKFPGEKCWGTLPPPPAVTPLEQNDIFPEHMGLYQTDTIYNSIFNKMLV